MVEYIRSYCDQVIEALTADDIWEDRRRIYGEVYRQPVAVVPAGACVVCGAPVRFAGARLCHEHAFVAPIGQGGVTA